MDEAGRRRQDPRRARKKITADLGSVGATDALRLSLADKKRGPIAIPDEVLRWASIPSALASG
jgi:hypothetical protein